MGYLLIRPAVSIRRRMGDRLDVRLRRTGTRSRHRATIPRLRGTRLRRSGSQSLRRRGTLFRVAVPTVCRRKGDQLLRMPAGSDPPFPVTWVAVEGSQGVSAAAAAAAADSDLRVVHGVGPPSAASGSPSRPSSAPAGLLDRQVKLLEVASDRLRAAACPRFCRAAGPEALQRQLSAAVRYRERLEWVPHAHEVEAEVLCDYGDIAGTPWMVAAT